MRDKWIESLQRSCGDLRAIRQRFLDKYRGKKHKVVKKSIDFGNSISHDPDVVFDASLYEDGHRSDMDTFLPLYGLSPEKTLQLRATGCEYVITAVEAYAALWLVVPSHVTHDGYISFLLFPDLTFPFFLSLPLNSRVDCPLASIVQYYRIASGLSHHICGGVNADIEMKFSEFVNAVNKTTNIPANADRWHLSAKHTLASGLLWTNRAPSVAFWREQVSTRSSVDLSATHT